MLIYELEIVYIWLQTHKKIENRSYENINAYINDNQAVGNEF